jgi:hypothetical protein
MAKYLGSARRPSPSPVELGIAARFLAPQQKSILSPVQRDLPPGVPEPQNRFCAPTCAHARPWTGNSGAGR